MVYWISTPGRDSLVDEEADSGIAVVWVYDVKSIFEPVARDLGLVSPWLLNRHPLTSDGHRRPHSNGCRRIHPIHQNITAIEAGLHFRMQRGSALEQTAEKAGEKNPR